MDPVKLEAVRKWPRPKTVKDIQKFLGFCNFYRRFVKNYSELARLLFNLTKKGEPFIWTERQDTAFTGLQDALTSSPVLLLPNYGRPFTLYTDASDYATSAILEQVLRSKDLKVRLARDIEWWRLNYGVQGSVPLAQD